MSLTLTHWPLGAPPEGAPRERAPSGNGYCMERVIMLADWHDATRRRGAHHAQDIFAPRGTPVLSPIAGRIAFVGDGGSGGNNLKIVTPEGSIQISHLDRPPLVVRGERVSPGQPLGVVGNTGARHTCPHLHIGARNSSGVAINIYDQLTALSVGAPGLRRPRTRTNANNSATSSMARNPDSPGVGALIVGVGIALAVLGAVSKRDN